MAAATVTRRTARPSDIRRPRGGLGAPPAAPGGVALDNGPVFSSLPAVAFLVFQAGSAPAGVVAPDLLARGRVARPRLRAGLAGESGNRAGAGRCRPARGPEDRRAARGPAFRAARNDSAD